MAEKRKDSKGRNLRPGEGQRAEDNRYFYRYTDLTGKRRTVYALTLQELRQKGQEITRDLEDGIDSAKGEMTLNELFDLYMDTKTNIRETTRHDYTSAWNNSVKCSTLGDMKISKIKQIHICALYGDMSKKGLAEGTIKLCHNLINGSFKMAVASDMIRKNPAEGAREWITGGKKEVVALTRTEQAAIMNFIENSNVYCTYFPMYSFDVNTGLRCSELAGLRWQDVDLKKNVIHIRQQLVYKRYDGEGEGYRFHVHDLKSKAGRRDVPLTKDARRALTKQKELDLFRGVQRQEVEGISDYVFVNSKGLPYNVSAIDQALIRIVDAYNCQETKKAESEKREPSLFRHFSVHVLRHTFASRAAESGMDAKTLQNILGHSDISTTMDIYVQLDADEIQRKMQAIEDAMRVG